MLTAKARLHDAVKDTGKHWIEDAISIAFDRSKTSRPELIMLARSLCQHSML
jgi:hypothetical protein